MSVLGLLYSLTFSCDNEVLTNTVAGLSDGLAGPLPYNTQDVTGCEARLCVSCCSVALKGKMLKCLSVHFVVSSPKSHFQERLHLGFIIVVTDEMRMSLCNVCYWITLRWFLSSEFGCSVTIETACFKTYNNFISDFMAHIEREFAEI